MSSTSRLELALNRIRGARVFTKMFLQDLTADEWYWSPPQYTTHMAWQVGHLAAAQYGLCLSRIRGRSADDASFISDAFIDAFKLGSQPVAGSAQGPPLDEIKRVFGDVHEKALEELASCNDTELDVALEQPRPAFKTKLEAVEWCAQHEMVHAGQIAMLRRLMGKAPLR